MKKKGVIKIFKAKALFKGDRIMFTGIIWQNLQKVIFIAFIDIPNISTIMLNTEIPSNSFWQKENVLTWFSNYTLSKYRNKDNKNT